MCRASYHSPDNLVLRVSHLPDFTEWAEMRDPGNEVGSLAPDVVDWRRSLRVNLLPRVPKHVSKITDDCKSVSHSFS